MKQSKNLFSILLLLIAGAFLFLITVFTTSHTKTNESDYIVLASDWNVRISNTVYENANLDELAFSPVNRGETIQLSRFLSSKEITNPALEIYFIHSIVHVYLEDTLLYSYGDELAAENKLLGYGYHYVTLPSDYMGKELRIELSITENNAFTGFTTPRIGNSVRIIPDYIHVNRIPFVISLFLITIGACVTAVSFFFIFKNNYIRQLWLIALFSFAIGFWSLCSYNLQTVLFESLRAKTYMEYFSLYLAPIAILSYLGQEGTNGGKLRKTCYWVLWISQVIFFVSAVTLQTFNIVHFPAMLPLQHLLIMGMLIFLLIIFGYDAIKKRLGSPVLVVGAIVMIFFAGFDLSKFLIEKYVMVAAGSFYTGFICVGALLFVFALFLDYCNGMTDVLYEAVASATYQQLAYTDSLTNLANRRKCEEFFDDLNHNISDYAIIAFDLNNLKQINDCLGHDVGDVYIKCFGTILKEVFSSIGLVSRVGGDEFVVAFKEAPANIDQLLCTMQKKIDALNEAHPDWNMSVAYGISYYQQDHAATAQYAHKMADARMYQKKAEMKSQ